MSNTNETIADIVADMRRDAADDDYTEDCILGQSLNEYADRIEAAAEREHEMSKGLSKKLDKNHAIPGDAAAMREALKRILAIEGYGAPWIEAKVIAQKALEGQQCTPPIAQERQKIEQHGNAAAIREAQERGDPMSANASFPRPWRVVENPRNGLRNIVVAANGQTVAEPLPIDGATAEDCEAVAAEIACPIAQETAKIEQPGNGDKAVDEDTSDGYHTFRELYRYRMLYNAAFFNMLSRHTSIPVVKSHRHGDGELCFGGGWFIVMAQLPTGQVSNHYDDRFWELFNVPEAERAPEWDGHTPNDAADRLESFLEMREPDRDKSNPPGNAAAMRDALEKLVYRKCLVKGSCGKPMDELCTLTGCIWHPYRAALSAPARNCDRTKDEAEEVFRREFGRPWNTVEDRLAAWLFAAAEGDAE